MSENETHILILNTLNLIADFETADMTITSQHARCLLDYIKSLQAENERLLAQVKLLRDTIKILEIDIIEKRRINDELKTQLAQADEIARGNLKLAGSLWQDLKLKMDGN